MSTPDHKLSWPSVLRRYLLASAGLHLAWEIAQLPLYTIWSEPLPKKAFAIAHCTIGDLMIAGLSLIAALALAAKPDWPRSGSREVWLLVLVSGVAYTVYSEWLNVNVRGSWAYVTLMPMLPILGTGLTPLLQWIVLPTVALGVAAGNAPWRNAWERKVRVMSNFKSFLGSTSGLVVCSALGLLGLYLLVYHLKHILLAVPYLVLLACPLMHLMHRGHHGDRPP